MIRRTFIKGLLIAIPLLLALPAGELKPKNYLGPEYTTDSHIETYAIWVDAGKVTFT